MKKLLTLFALILATSFATAQELTPDMLVGEYEGKADALYNMTNQLQNFKDVKLNISEIDGSDSLKFVLNVRRSEVVAYLYLDNNEIELSFSETENLDGFSRTTKVMLYEGDKIPVVKPSYNSKKESLSLSLFQETSFSDSEDVIIKYFNITVSK